MAIFAISDLHLSFGVDKPMNVFGKIWNNYEDKIKKDWEEKVEKDDTVIIAGDISWGINFEESYKDFKFINELPGKKIILRGNHDYYFNTKTKVEKFLLENEFNTIKILHNNAFEIEDYIICGTRGWDEVEGKEKEENLRIIKREEGRLELSLKVGKKLNPYKKIIVAMHFPPYNSGKFEEIMKEYDVKLCIYGHLHGYGHKMVKEGLIGGIDHKMVSCDFTRFKLIKIS